MTTLQKLHDQFESLALQIEKVEKQQHVCYEFNLATTSVDRKLEKLEDKQYEIQCKIEELESQPIEYISCGTHYPEYDAYCDHKYGGNACTTKGGVA